VNDRARYAVVDQGSTSTKCALCDASGVAYSEVSEPTPRKLRDGRIEVDAEEIAAGVIRLLDRVLASGPVAAIGVTCQRSTCLVWDRHNGNAITPALSWQDTSQTSRIEALADHAEGVAEKTGLRLSPHYAAPKLAALLDDLPDGRERAQRGEIVFGTLDAFLLHRLTGTPATEPGHAGRTLLYNLSQGTWDTELCELFGVPQQGLPDLRASAGNWGSYRGIPITAVAGDQQAALIGHGGWDGGTVATHFGTGAFVLASTGPRPRRDDRLLSAVVASTGAGRRFQLEGSVNSAGATVDWACKLTGEKLGGWIDRRIEPEALPWVVPALAGLGAPWWRPRARGVVRGLDLATRGSHLVGGALFGIAMRVIDNLEALADAGIAFDTVRLSGKMTRLKGLVGLISDASGKVVDVSKAEETGLAGICHLAASGLHGSEDPLGVAAPISARRKPHWEASKAEDLRRRWLELIDSIE